MKTVLFSALFLMSGTMAFADGVTCSPGYIWGYDTCSAPDFQCVSAKLKAKNADVYKGWTTEQLQFALDNSPSFGHDAIVEAAELCNQGK